MDSLDIITIIYILLIIIGIYVLFQLERSYIIKKIRIKWALEENTGRLRKFSYLSMMKPNKRNWYTFRTPKEEHYYKYITKKTTSMGGL